MQTDNERLYVQFHDKANSIFFAQLNNFELAVKTINRKTEEYKFQLVGETYVHMLKQQLEEAAIRIMQEHPHNRKEKELSQNLQEFIRQYLHRFVQAIGDM